MFYELGLSTMDYLLTPPAIRANMMSPACQVVIVIIIIIVVVIIIVIVIVIAIVIIIVITILTGVSNSDLLPIPHRVFDRYTCVTEPSGNSRFRDLAEHCCVKK